MIFKRLLLNWQIYNDVPEGSQYVSIGLGSGLVHDVNWCQELTNWPLVTTKTMNLNQNWNILVKKMLSAKY